MYRIHQFILGSSLFMLPALSKAANSIPYKVSLLPQYQWTTYALILLILLLFSLYTAKKQARQSIKNSNCRLIEKLNLSNKTTLYLLEYQNQQFLLADNLQSITFKSLNCKDRDD